MAIRSAMVFAFLVDVGSTGSDPAVGALRIPHPPLAELGAVGDTNSAAPPLDLGYHPKGVNCGG